MSFKDIKGQDQPIQILKNYLIRGNTGGAYLFTGQEGIGKFLTAKTFAKAINCLKDDHDACGECASCRKIEKNEHPDIYFIEAQDSDVIKIEAIRELKRTVSLKPYEARKRVFAINDAHNLNAESANALLKVLEEPPCGNLIILVTSRPGLLFKTIVSRCRTIKFYPLAREGLKEMLFNSYRVDNNLAHFLAYFCEGRIGSALKLNSADTLLHKNRVIDALVSPDTRGLEDFFTQEKAGLRAGLNIIAAYLRDIYLSKAGADTMRLINIDRREKIAEAAQRFSFSQLDRMLKFISNAVIYLEQNINKRLIFINLKEELWKR